MENETQKYEKLEKVFSIGPISQSLALASNDTPYEEIDVSKGLPWIGTDEIA